VRYLDRLLSQPGLPALPPSIPSQVTAYLAPSEQAFDALTGGAVPHWGAGVALPDSAMMVIPAYSSSRSGVGQEGAVLRHEWAHLGLHEYLHGLQVPRWFDEGYAVWAEAGFDVSEAWRLRLLLTLGRAPSLDSLSFDFPEDRASAEVAYLLAASTVVYLVEQSGERGIELMLRRWRSSGSFEAALVATYGLTSGRLETEWRKWVRSRFGWLTVLSHSLVVWTVLALVLLGATAGRRRWNRDRMAQLRATEPDEAPAYWLEVERPTEPAGPPESGPGP
jgi:hypothetical protein